MEEGGLDKIRRAELLARVAELDKLIREQRARATFMRQMGYSAALAEERLKLLEESRQLHLSALRALLRKDAGDGERANGRAE